MMKKIALILLLCLPLLMAQTVVYVNSAVVTWNLSAGLADGSAFLPGDVITYEVVIARPADKVHFTLLGTTALPPYTVTLPAEGDWVVGVRTIRVAGTERLLSEFLWSDGTTSPFILRFYKGPAVPTNLRLQ